MNMLQLTYRFALVVFPFLAVTGALPTAQSGHHPLRFTKGGTFQLSVFADLHYGEAEDLDWGPQQDINSTRVMNAVLSTESPQLVVLNGDLITGENTYFHNSTHYIDRIVQPMVQRGLPWASTYGNHDSNYNLSRCDMLEREQKYPGSLTQNMFAADTGGDGGNYTTGVTNYYLPVYSSDRKNTAPVLLLWFFDSRGGNEYRTLDDDGNTVGIPEWVDESVVSWFTTTRNSLFHTYKKAIPSLAFVHIPITAMLAFQDAGVHPHKEPGINDDVPLATQGLDTPFMSALLNTSGLMAVFSGHDHGDDWCAKWTHTLPVSTDDPPTLRGNGLNLCFNRHSGYGGYGSWTRGGRQIFVAEQDLCKVVEGAEDTVARASVETWNRLEDGSVSGTVVLNGTYGRDLYASVPTTYS